MNDFQTTTKFILSLKKNVLISTLLFFLKKKHLYLTLVRSPLCTELCVLYENMVCNYGQFGILPYSRRPPSSSLDARSRVTLQDKLMHLSTRGISNALCYNTD
jgi:hypothetical protein